MKKIIPILLLLITCLACEKDLDTYVGKSGIYFDTSEIGLDTVRVHWGLKNASVTEQTVRLKVCLFGNAADYDRPFKIEVADNKADEWQAQEGMDYNLASYEYVMPANAAETYIDVKVFRSDDLKIHPKRVTIKLVESEELQFLYTREETVTVENETENKDEHQESYLRPLDYQRVICMDEKFPMPIWWDMYGENAFGDWSVTKSALICDVMGIDREVWVMNNIEGLTPGYITFAGKYMHRWLQENPQIDEDGEPMEMGFASQN